MTLKEKLGQLFIVGLAGTELNKLEEAFLIEHNVGGIVLMGRNIQSPEQVHQLCVSIQKLRHKTKSKTPFFISIDMEGGRVARFKEPFTQWPALKKLGDLNSPSLAFNMAISMAKEMRAVGVNVDFAPCVDVLTNSENKVIGDRALSTDPEVVSKMSSALIRGYMKSEIIACAKHFPGHGNTFADSHEELPVEELNFERLEKIELVPFRRAIRSRVDLIMMSHVLYKKIDEQYPASLSLVFNKILREDLRHRGLIITDDLDMKALTRNWSVEDIAIRAIEVGNDLLLYCNDSLSPGKALEALEKAVAETRISIARIEDSYQKVLKLKRESILNIDPQPWNEVKGIIGHSEHLLIAKAIQEGRIPDGLAQGA